MKKLIIAFAMSLTACLSQEEATQQARSWVNSMGYKDAVIFCDNDPGFLQQRKCSVRVPTVALPIALTCTYERTCVQAH